MPAPMAIEELRERPLKTIGALTNEIVDLKKECRRLKADLAAEKQKTNELQATVEDYQQIWRSLG